MKKIRWIRNKRISVIKLNTYTFFLFQSLFAFEWFMMLVNVCYIFFFSKKKQRHRIVYRNEKNYSKKNIIHLCDENQFTHSISFPIQIFCIFLYYFNFISIVLFLPCYSEADLSIVLFCVCLKVSLFCYYLLSLFIVFVQKHSLLILFWPDAYFMHISRRNYWFYDFYFAAWTIWCSFDAHNSLIVGFFSIHNVNILNTQNHTYINSINTKHSHKKVCFPASDFFFSLFDTQMHKTDC